MRAQKIIRSAATIIYIFSNNNQKNTKFCNEKFKIGQTERENWHEWRYGFFFEADLKKKNDDGKFSEIPLQNKKAKEVKKRPKI